MSFSNSSPREEYLASIARLLLFSCRCYYYFLICASIFWFCFPFSQYLSHPGQHRHTHIRSLAANFLEGYSVSYQFLHAHRHVCGCSCVRGCVSVCVAVCVGPHKFDTFISMPQTPASHLPCSRRRCPGTFTLLVERFLGGFCESRVLSPLPAACLPCSVLFCCPCMCHSYWLECA